MPRNDEVFTAADIALIARDAAARFLGIAPGDVTADDLQRFYDWCDDADREAYAAATDEAVAMVAAGAWR